MVLLVSELNNGESGMSMILRELFQLVWESECISESWGEGMIVSLF